MLRGDADADPFPLVMVDKRDAVFAAVVELKNVVVVVVVEMEVDRRAFLCVEVRDEIVADAVQAVDEEAGRERVAESSRFWVCGRGEGKGFSEAGCRSSPPDGRRTLSEYALAGSRRPSALPAADRTALAIPAGKRRTDTPKTLILGTGVPVTTREAIRLHCAIFPAAA